MSTRETSRQMGWWRRLWLVLQCGAFISAPFLIAGYGIYLGFGHERRNDRFKKTFGSTIQLASVCQLMREPDPARIPHADIADKYIIAVWDDHDQEWDSHDTHWLLPEGKRAAKPDEVGLVVLLQKVREEELPGYYGSVSGYRLHYTMTLIDIKHEKVFARRELHGGNPSSKVVRSFAYKSGSTVADVTDETIFEEMDAALAPLSRTVNPKSGRR